MKILSQRDPQWAAEKLGASTLTIGRWGCTTTSISMISDYFGCYKSPLEIAKNVHNYTADGLVLWKNITFDKMEFVRRAYGTTVSLFPEIKAALKDDDQAVLLQVDNGAHWVVAYSTKWFSADLAVADPWFGKIVPVLKTYKNITGAAFYKRKAGAAPKKEDKPVLHAVDKKLIKGDQSPDIYYYNGDKRFLFPNWFTFVELGGNMSNVQIIPQHVLDSLPAGENITDIKP